MSNIVFLGPPGSGKGTQAAIISKDLNIPAISTGEILRKELSSESEVGLQAKSYMESGKLVPDDVVVEIIRKRILESDCSNGFILDGFPRNLAQAQILEAMLEKNSKKIDAAINVEVEDDVVIKRISGRFSCKKCGAVYNKFFNNTSQEGVCDVCGSNDFESRKDDNEDTVRNRLKVYEESSKDLISFYEKNNLIYSVNGLNSLSLITEEIKGIINNLN